MNTRSLHILLLNQYYPPDSAATAKTAQLLAEALAERYRVTVLAGRPSYDPTEYHPYYIWRRRTNDSLTIERVGSTAYNRRQMRGRVMNYLSYLALAIPRALMINADIILGMTDPPGLGIAGAMVARLQRRPFVYNIKDLHPDMTVAARIVRPAGWVDRWEQLHRWALKQAARVVVLGEDMRQRVITKGVDPNRVAVVRDGVRIPAIIASSSHPVAREIRCDFPFLVLHAGNLGFSGAWETLVRALLLLDGEGVGLVFVGDGAARPRIEALADGCHRIRFLPFRTPEDVPYVLAAGDIHIVTVRRGLEGVVVPSKLYPILAAGRPVLAVTSELSDVARIVTQSGCGIVADPDQPVSVATAIRGLMSDRARLERMAQKARAIAPEFESGKQLNRLVKLIREVARS